MTQSHRNPTQPPDDWTPVFARWRHGGWTVSNLRYPAGHSGCVSCNYPDGKWRIVCDSRRRAIGDDTDFTFESRDAAARAEYLLAQAEHERLAPWLSPIEDEQVRYTAASMLSEIERAPHRSAAWHAQSVSLIRKTDINVLRQVASAYLEHLQQTAPATLQVSTLAGQTLELRPIPLSRMPSQQTSDWLRFLGQHVPGTGLDEEAQEQVQAFMRRHRTEALSDGTRALTLAGHMLAHCDPSPFAIQEVDDEAPTPRMRA